jgi:DNA modification methylase
MEITGYKDKHEYVSESGVKSTVYLMDCMELMSQLSENQIGLAVVDPPYGIGEDGRKGVRTSPSRPNSYLREPKYKAKVWDNKPPDKAYFNELLRVSKNVIIWGQTILLKTYQPQIVVVGLYGTKRMRVLTLQTVNWHGQI